MINKILLTGGSGLLGTELQKYIDCIAPSHKNLDITKIDKPLGDYDTIIHCAAYTDVAKAKIEKTKCFDINVKGTMNLVKAYPNAKFIYISSEYANNPVNFYSYTKLWGEKIVETYSNNYLIIRTLFKANPFPYEYAFFDQYTQGDYVELIAPPIAFSILNKESGTIYVGTGRKTIFELARRTKPDIKAISVDDIKDVVLPKDYV